MSDVLAIHNLLIDRFGGSRGVRDSGSLESAINRPYATFGDQDLYSEPQDKAAAILESILINHPFVDGNKRSGYILMKLILMQSGFDITASQNEKYDMLIAVSIGEMRFDEIKEWIKKRMKKINTDS